MPEPGDADHWQIKPSVLFPYFGSGALKVTDDLGIVLNNDASSGLLTIPIGLAGVFLVSISVTGDNGVLTPPTLTMTNCSLIATWKGGTADRIQLTGTSTVQIMNFLVTKVNPLVNGRVTFTGATPFPANATSGDVVIVVVEDQYN